MKKRMLAAMLALLMVVTMLPTAWAVVEGACTCTAKCTDTANGDCVVCNADLAVLADVRTGQEAAAIYSVTVSRDGGGSITGEGSYAPGAQVTITATPDTEGGYCTAG